ncbi:pol protein [Echinococcus multilocularis]|uniref:Pol protein n=1 Tax=Echinococcus multilocularis TaxID=6211 RepID=A0A068Y1T6_ECHMU|nr:pol protein [Echinococcus multilocularis]
MPCCCPTR